MMNKGLDSSFMHYGIRREDMEIIKRICEKHEVNFDWFKDEVLREYHESRMKNEALEPIDVQRLIEKAINNHP